MNNKEAAQYTAAEWDRLQRGAELVAEKRERTAQRGSMPSKDQRRREQDALERFA